MMRSLVVPFGTLVAGGALLVAGVGDRVIVVPNPFANAILTFRGGANGQEPPIRVLQGPKTRMTGADRFGLDHVSGERQPGEQHDFSGRQRERQYRRRRGAFRSCTEERSRAFPWSRC